MKNSLLNLTVGKFEASGSKDVETCMLVFSMVLFPKVTVDSDVFGISFVSLYDGFISKEWILTSSLCKFVLLSPGVSNKWNKTLFHLQQKVGCCLESEVETQRALIHWSFLLCDISNLQLWTNTQTVIPTFHIVFSIVLTTFWHTKYFTYLFFLYLYTRM